MLSRATQIIHPRARRGSHQPAPLERGTLQGVYGGPERPRPRRDHNREDSNIGTGRHGGLFPPSSLRMDKGWLYVEHYMLRQGCDVPDRLHPWDYSLPRLSGKNPTHTRACALAHKPPSTVLRQNSIDQKKTQLTDGHQAFRPTSY